MEQGKIIKENTILSVLYLLFLVIGVKTSLVFFMVLIFIFPLIIIGYRNESKMAIVFISVNILMSVLILGWAVGLACSVLAGSVGFVIGSLYKKEKLLPAFATGVIVVIINFIILLGIINFVYDVSLAELIDDNLRVSLSSIENILSEELDENARNALLEQYNYAIDIFTKSIPFFVISLAVVVVLTNHFIASRILRKFKHDIPKMIPFREWMFPKSIIFFYLLTVIIIFMTENNSLFNTIALNMFPILALILAIQGVSFVFYYAHIKKINKIVPILAIIVALIPVINQAIQMLGMIDISFDVRQKIKS